MKKSSFVAMILGTVSGILFAMGMCMTMLPEWDAFQSGAIIGCVGIVFALITVFIWRKMEHKSPIKITGKAILTLILGILGALTLGVGMCFTMVWGELVVGILIGIVGMVLLLCLIPICKGLK